MSTEQNGTHDIAAMIGDTEDRATRATLVVLHKISKNIADNARRADIISARMDNNQKIFNAHIDAFKAHAEKESKMFERITGMWKVLAYILPGLGSVVIGAGLWILVKQINVNESQGLMIAKLQAEMAEVRANMQRNMQIIEREK